MKIAIAGASGLIGRALAADLGSDGHQVIRLVRHPPQGPDQVRWDPLAPDGGLAPAALSGADAVVNLAGAPVAAGRWTPARKAELRSSRIQGTASLTAAMAAASHPPPVLLCGSATGWYADTGDRQVDESDPAGQGFLADLVRDWEAAAQQARQAAGARVASLRTGIVLARDGGMLARLAPLFRFGLGARLGSGRQYLSWISLADEVRAIRFLLEHDLDGPVNLTAPAPVTNAEFTAALGRALHRPAVLLVPAVALRAGLGELSGELLVSQRVRPARLLEAGFAFRHGDIHSALSAELSADRSAG